MPISRAKEYKGAIKSATREKIKPCLECSNQVMFELSNGKDSYAVSMEAILGCLKIAEQEGAVPLLEEDWWLKIFNRYNELGNFDGCI